MNDKASESIDELVAHSKAMSRAYSIALLPILCLAGAMIFAQQIGLLPEAVLVRWSIALSAPVALMCGWIWMRLRPRTQADPSPTKRSLTAYFGSWQFAAYGSAAMLPMVAAAVQNVSWPQLAVTCIATLVGFTVGVSTRTIAPLGVAFAVGAMIVYLPLISLNG
jgi:hypothetical protein